MEKIYALIDVRPSVATAVTAITLALSLGLAETFYKFQSFTLEASAFLATWWALRRVALLFVKR